MKRLILSATDVYKVKDLPSNIWAREADDNEIYYIINIKYFKY